MSATLTITARSPHDAQLQALHGPVLLASDGRAPTDATALAARRIAERLREPLVVVAALPSATVFPLPYEAPVLPPDFDAARRAELQGTVARRLEPVLGPPAEWTLDVAYGPAGWAIPDAARERGAGLIVVGSGGHGALERLFGGDVALDVVRHATIPVLAVAPDRAEPPRRAVAGIDFGAASVRAAKVALALLEPDLDDPARLTLVHVSASPEEIPLPGMPLEDYDTRIATMFTRLREMLRPYLPDGVVIETRVRTGTVVESLRAAAEAEDADLVVVGTHGPGWVERLFLGSVAGDVLRKAKTSVLVCPAPAAAERLRVELRLGGRVALDRPADWRRALDLFTERNAGRPVRIEIGDPTLRGPTMEATRFRFLGATYDPHDRRVAVMLGDADDRTRHLTHSVSRVHGLEILAGIEDDQDRALLVEDARGHTLLTFEV